MVRACARPTIAMGTAADEHDWERVVRARPLERDEQRLIAEQLTQATRHIQQGDDERESLENEVRRGEEHRNQIVQRTLRPLPQYTRYSRVNSRDLASHDDTFKYLAQRFHESVTQHRGPFLHQAQKHEAPQYDVLRIEKLSNPRLRDAYLTELQDQMGLCNQRVTTIPDSHFGDQKPFHVQSTDDGDMNELLLYHGCDAALFARLTHQGLDPRYAGSNVGKLFGYGTYLACHSSKSDIYTKPLVDGEHADERCMLVVRACLGEPHYVSRPYDLVQNPPINWRMPPERPDRRGPLSSVVGVTTANGGQLDHPEFIVYDKRQTLPQFAIWYKHKPACFCTHCVKSKVKIEVRIGHSYRHTFCVPMELSQPFTVDNPDNTIVTTVAAVGRLIVDECRIAPNRMQLFVAPGADDPLDRNTAVELVLSNATLNDAIQQACNRPALCGTTLLLAPRPPPPPPPIPDAQRQMWRLVQIKLEETTYALIVRISAAVASLKRLMVHHTGIPAAHQRFIFQGTELDDHVTLQDPRLANPQHKIILQPRWR